MAVVTDRLIFIHVYKTGGNTVRCTLNLSNDDEVGGAHVEASYVRRYLREHRRDDQWRSAFKFGVVRNPYTWLASLYNYIGSTSHAHAAYASQGFPAFIDWLVNSAMKETREPAENKYLTQRQFLYEGRECLVDFVARTESLERDLITVAKRAQIPLPSIITKNVRHHATPHELFDASTLKIVNQTFNEDFETFGYKPVHTLGSQRRVSIHREKIKPTAAKQLLHAKQRLRKLRNQQAR